MVPSTRLVTVPSTSPTVFEDLAGQRVEGPDHVPGGVDDVPGRRVEDADDVAGRVRHRRRRRPGR